MQIAYSITVGALQKSAARSEALFWRPGSWQPYWEVRGKARNAGDLPIATPQSLLKLSGVTLSAPTDPNQRLLIHLDLQALYQQAQDQG